MTSWNGTSEKACGWVWAPQHVTVWKLVHSGRCLPVLPCGQQGQTRRGLSPAALQASFKVGRTGTFDHSTDFRTLFQHKCATLKPLHWCVQATSDEVSAISPPLDAQGSGHGTGWATPMRTAWPSVALHVAPQKLSPNAQRPQSKTRPLQSSSAACISPSQLTAHWCQTRLRVLRRHWYLGCLGTTQAVFSVPVARVSNTL